MFTNVSLLAPVGALALLGTGFIIGLLVLLLVHAIIRRKTARARVALLVTGFLVATYVSILLVFSLKSNETVLARGQEKHFCEIDCHLAYSIVDVRQAKTVGRPLDHATASGIYYIVTIRTRFDEETISRTRGNAPLLPNSRVLTLIDDQCRQYSQATEAERALGNTEDTGLPLTTPLRPSESYVTTVVFDLPEDPVNPTLLLTEGAWITRLVIGNENSPLHEKTRFWL